ncbi:MAG TPA: antibiotic biosynthesis monooxygenase family protein, partial [Candidatus Binatia bacterium]|nr:antibiotic biosynthesis monooxygenase family protein [Candidatus Binatia bacterium]
MFARVLRCKVKPGMWDDYERYYNEKVVPPTQKMKGFQERRLLRSLDNPDEGTSICVWKTKEDLENYVRSIERRSIVLEAEKLFAGE